MQSKIMISHNFFVPYFGAGPNSTTSTFILSALGYSEENILYEEKEDINSCGLKKINFMRKHKNFPGVSCGQR